MTLLLGTEEGVYRASAVRFNEATKVLGTDRVMRVRRFPWSDVLYACSKSGLYRSADGGKTWSADGVPRDEVYSVAVSPEGNALYAGTHPAHLYVTEDDGDSWQELAGFQELPSREEWYTPRHRNEAHIRSLNTHPEAPARIIAGVEVGGVHVSEDRGESWVERRTGLQNDVHHVLVMGPDEYIASCGGGLYRTRDTGRSWDRLDEELDHRYFREAIRHDGRLYAAAARDPPGTWEGESGADGGLFVSETDGDDFESVAYPGQPQEVILAWTVSEGDVVAATNDGRVLIETDSGWETTGHVAPWVRSICMS